MVDPIISRTPRTPIMSESQLKIIIDELFDEYGQKYIKSFVLQILRESLFLDRENKKLRDEIDNLNREMLNIKKEPKIILS